MSEHKNKNKQKVTTGAVITFILVFICLTAGLALSYYRFTQDKIIFTVKSGAVKVYSALDILNSKNDGIETSEELLNDLKEMCPDIFGVGATHTKNGNDITLSITENSEQKNILPENLKENSYAVSDIETVGTEFSFTYYHYINGKLYALSYAEGNLGAPEILLENSNK